MKNLSLRLRYLLSYLAVLFPLMVFSLVLLYSTVEQSKQYTNTSSLQQFTYAAENISSIIQRMDDVSSTAFSLENQWPTGEQEAGALPNGDAVANILSYMQEQLPQGVTPVFYIRGSTLVYTAQGSMPFTDWEQKNATDFNLPRSQLFYHMLVSRQNTLISLRSSQDETTTAGIAYITPLLRGGERSTAVLVYILHASVLDAQFQNYLGNAAGDIFLYTERNGGVDLFHRAAQAQPRMPFFDMIRHRGVGLQTVSPNGEQLVMMRVSDSRQGLHCVMLTPHDDFYADTMGTRRVFGFLIALMVAAALVLALFSAFTIYRPINDLVEHITGRRRQERSDSDLELIRTAWDHTVDEAARLSTHLSELRPVVAQQFVAKLIFGKISSPEEFDRLSRSAAIPFPFPWTAALYVLLSREHPERELDEYSLIVSRFHPAQASVTYGEMLNENALCVLINFSAEESLQDGESRKLAQQLCDSFIAEDKPHVRIGVGRAYRNPLQMPESFAEASAAVQLAPPSQERVFAYSPQSTQEGGEQGFTGISTLSLTLLTEGLHRGEKTVALRALGDILQEITATTTSFVYFRFYCSSLLGTILRQASDLNLPLDQRQRDSLIAYESQEEFTEKATALLEGLCDAVRTRQQQEDDRIKRRVMDHILANYKRFDLSIQAVSDELGIRKGQISSLLKEDMGQTFVQYVSYLRLNEFKRLLLETDLAIQECVNQIGYSDVSNFLRKFKSVEGCTPGQYRAMYRKA